MSMDQSIHQKIPIRGQQRESPQNKTGHFMGGGGEDLGAITFDRRIKHSIINELSSASQLPLPWASVLFKSKMKFSLTSESVEIFIDFFKEEVTN